MNPITTYLKEREELFIDLFDNRGDIGLTKDEIISFHHQTAKELVEVVINEIENRMKQLGQVENADEAIESIQHSIYSRNPPSHSPEKMQALGELLGLEYCRKVLSLPTTE